MPEGSDYEKREREKKKRLYIYIFGGFRLNSRQMKRKKKISKRERKKNAKKKRVQTKKRLVKCKKKKCLESEEKVKSVSEITRFGVLVYFDRSTLVSISRKKSIMGFLYIFGNDISTTI